MCSLAYDTHPLLDEKLDRAFDPQLEVIVSKKTKHHLSPSDEIIVVGGEIKVSF